MAYNVQNRKTTPTTTTPTTIPGAVAHESPPSKKVGSIYDARRAGLSEVSEYDEKKKALEDLEREVKSLEKQIALREPSGREGQAYEEEVRRLEKNHDEPVEKYEMALSHRNENIDWVISAKRELIELEGNVKTAEFALKQAGADLQKAIAKYTSESSANMVAKHKPPTFDRIVGQTPFTMNGLAITAKARKQIERMGNGEVLLANLEFMQKVSTALSEAKNASRSKNTQLRSLQQQYPRGQFPIDDRADRIRREEDYLSNATTYWSGRARELSMAMAEMKEQFANMYNDPTCSAKFDSKTEFADILANQDQAPTPPAESLIERNKAWGDAHDCLIALSAATVGAYNIGLVLSGKDVTSFQRVGLVGTNIASVPISYALAQQGKNRIAYGVLTLLLIQALLTTASF